MKHFSCSSQGSREKNTSYYENEVAEVSPGWEPQQLRCCHIRNKTERLSGRKWTAQDYTFSIFVWLTGNHPLESRGKRFKNIHEKYMLYYERKGNHVLVMAFARCVRGNVHCYNNTVELALFSFLIRVKNMSYYEKKTRMVWILGVVSD